MTPTPPTPDPSPVESGAGTPASVLRGEARDGAGVAVGGSVRMPGELRDRLGVPVYEDEFVTLYNADSRALLGIPRPPTGVDLIVTDPPYGETSLEWDAWPDWPWAEVMYYLANQMWVFGSMRMFLEHRDDFALWQFAQDIVWEKHNGSGLASDRFRRVHEHAAHFYVPPWASLHHEVPTTADATARTVRSKAKPAQWQGARGPSEYASHDGGPRLMRSVIHARSMHGRAIHPTEKPLAVLEPLIRYSCPPDGLVLDPFAGSASTLLAAKAAGRHAIGIEVRPDYCEAAIRRLSQGLLDFGGAA